MAYLLIIAGFLFLLKGADYFVEGSSTIAKKLGVSSLVIGLTLVAFGTSSPELTVSLIASLQGSNDIAIGNIVGSNISNLLLILGIASIIQTLRVESETIWRIIPFSFLAVLALWISVNDGFLNGGVQNHLSRGEGLLFLLFFSIFVFYTVTLAKKTKETKVVEEEFKEEIEEITQKKSSWLQAIIMTILGLIGIIIGGKMVVDGAIEIAKALNISEALIGLTVVAIGSSLPELATTIVAAIKKESDIAVGNIMGSNIFNVFLVLGVSAMPHSIDFDPKLNVDIYIAIVATVILFIAGLTKRRLSRSEGIIFVTLYISYITYIIFRG
jgi:cation:H+ antiporter